LQREKAVEELNLTLNNLEETERKCHSILKEKDKLLAEEKAKLIRKLEQSAELRGDIEELIKEKLLFIDRIAELKVVLTNEKQFSDHLSEKLKADTDFSSSYESEIEALKIEETEKQEAEEEDLGNHSHAVFGEREELQIREEH
jgi:hypothetical protein